MRINQVIHSDIGCACYIPDLDIIKMPNAKYFKKMMIIMQHYCMNSHWTLHESRLNREIKFFMYEVNCKEELIAEISSTILLKHLR